MITEHGKTWQDKIVSILSFIFFLFIIIFGWYFAARAEIGTEGKVSYYTDKSVDPRWGGVTKSGEKFDENKFTCAVLPSEWGRLKGKIIRVTNLDNFRSVLVLVNDTGGFKKYGRMVDLSKAAFERIANKNKGVILARVEVVDGTEEKSY